jgi:hypothetical protein
VIKEIEKAIEILQAMDESIVARKSAEIVSRSLQEVLNDSSSILPNPRTAEQHTQPIGFDFSEFVSPISFKLRNS